MCLASGMFLIWYAVCFWCGQIHYVGKWEGVGPWKWRVFTFLGPVKWHRADRRVPFGAHYTVYTLWTGHSRFSSKLIPGGHTEIAGLRLSGVNWLNWALKRPAQLYQLWMWWWWGITGTRRRRQQDKIWPSPVLFSSLRYLLWYSARVSPADRNTAYTRKVWIWNRRY